MANYYQLERRTEKYVGDDCKFDNLFNCLKEYNIPELRSLIVYHYSKLDAIDRHIDDLTLDLARALLTDQGILFAQTRERSYPIEHSRRLLDSTRDERTGETELRLGKNDASQHDEKEPDQDGIIINDIVTSVHNHCECVLAEIVSEDGLPEKLNTFDKMLRKILSMCSALNHVGSKLYHPDKDPGSEDPGYVKGGSTEDQIAWMKTVKLHFPGRTKPVGAAKWLNKHVEGPISDEEMFFFLAYALPDAVHEAKKLDKSHRLSRATGRKPDPMISSKQREKLSEQIEAFRQRDPDNDVLTPWKGASKLLRLYFSFNAEKYSNIRKNDISNLDGLDECFERFSTSFQNYYRAILPTANETTLEREKDLSDELAYFFLRKASEDQKPLFIDQPLTIYRIARSPVHRNICKEQSTVKIFQMIQSSNSNTSWPILKKFLNAEQNLYNEIIEVCAKGCESFNIPFEKSNWKILWGCIEQSVKSLSYDYEDLLSAGWLFKSGYHVFHRFFPVLDQWLRDKLSDMDNPFEPALWRGMYNNHNRLLKERMDGTFREIDFEEDFLIPYRKIFTSKVQDIDSLLEILNALAGCFGWNYVTRLPTVEELIQADKRISCKHKKYGVEQLESYVEIIRHALSEEGAVAGQSDRNTVKEIQLVMTEWILLQQICYQAQFNLFRAIDKAINGDRECDAP